MLNRHIAQSARLNKEPRGTIGLEDQDDRKGPLSLRQFNDPERGLLFCGITLDPLRHVSISLGGKGQVTQKGELREWYACCLTCLLAGQTDTHGSAHGEEESKRALVFFLRARAKGASLSLLTCIWGSLGTLAR